MLEREHPVERKTFFFHMYSPTRPPQSITVGFSVFGWSLAADGLKLLLCLEEIPLSGSLNSNKQHGRTVFIFVRSSSVEEEATRIQQERLTAEEENRTLRETVFESQGRTRAAEAALKRVQAEAADRDKQLRIMTDQNAELLRLLEQEEAQTARLSAANEVQQEACQRWGNTNVGRARPSKGGYRVASTGFGVCLRPQHCPLGLDLLIFSFHPGGSTRPEVADERVREDAVRSSERRAQPHGDKHSTAQELQHVSIEQGVGESWPSGPPSPQLTVRRLTFKRRPEYVVAVLFYCCMRGDLSISPLVGTALTVQTQTPTTGNRERAGGVALQVREPSRHSQKPRGDGREGRKRGATPRRRGVADFESREGSSRKAKPAVAVDRLSMMIANTIG